MEKQPITKTKLYGILGEQSTTHGDSISSYIKASTFSRLGDKILLEPGYSTCRDKLSMFFNDKIINREAKKYDTGMVIFWQEIGPTYLVLPPFPVNEDKVISGSFEISGLSGSVLMTKEVTALGDWNLFEDSNQNGSRDTGENSYGVVFFERLPGQEPFSTNGHFLFAPSTASSLPGDIDAAAPGFQGTVWAVFPEGPHRSPSRFSQYIYFF